MKIEITRTNLPDKPARHLNVGEIAEVVGNDGVTAAVLLMSKNGLVNLSNPSDAYDYNYTFVKLLNAGTKLTLTYVPAPLILQLRSILTGAVPNSALSRKIEAIKLLREATGLGLKDSKYYVDDLEVKLMKDGSLPVPAPKPEFNEYGHDNYDDVPEFSEQR